jgi:hypothetical protein
VGFPPAAVSGAISSPFSGSPPAALTRSPFTVRAIGRFFSISWPGERRSRRLRSSPTHRYRPGGWSGESPSGPDQSQALRSKNATVGRCRAQPGTTRRERCPAKRPRSWALVVPQRAQGLDVLVDPPSTAQDDVVVEKDKRWQSSSTQARVSGWLGLDRAPGRRAGPGAVPDIGGRGRAVWTKVLDEGGHQRGCRRRPR